MMVLIGQGVHYEVAGGLSLIDGRVLDEGGEVRYWGPIIVWGRRFGLLGADGSLLLMRQLLNGSAIYAPGDPGILTSSDVGIIWRKPECGADGLSE